MAGFAPSAEMALCLGAPAGCEGALVGGGHPPVFPAHVSTANYCLAVLALILLLNWRTGKTVKRLNERFLSRFGPNSRFGTRHVGVSQQRLTRAILFVGVVLIGVELVGKRYFEARDFETSNVYAAAFYTMTDLSRYYFCCVLAPLAFVLEDGKTKNGMKRVLEEIWKQWRPNNNQVAPMT